jgi:hypothetical protein
MFKDFFLYLTYCKVHAGGVTIDIAWQRTHATIAGTTMEATSVFFVVRSGNDVIQQ